MADEEARSPSREPKKSQKVGCSILLTILLIIVIALTIVFVVYLIRRGTYRDRAVAIVNELNDTAHVECAVNNSEIRSMDDLEPNEKLEFWFEENIMVHTYIWCYANYKDTLQRKFDVWGNEAPEEHARIYTLFDDGIYCQETLVYHWNPVPGSPSEKKEGIIIYKKV